MEGGLMSQQIFCPRVDRNGAPGGGLGTIICNKFQRGDDSHHSRDEEPLAGIQASRREAFPSPRVGPLCTLCFCSQWGFTNEKDNERVKECCANFHIIY